MDTTTCTSKYLPWSRVNNPFAGACWDGGTQDPRSLLRYPGILFCHPSTSSFLSEAQAVDAFSWRILPAAGMMSIALKWTLDQVNEGDS